MIALGLPVFSFCMDNFYLRKRIDDMSDKYTFLPRWVEIPQIREAMTAELAHDLVFPNDSQYDPQYRMDLGAREVFPEQEYLTNHGYADQTHFEVDRRLDSLQSQSYHSPNFRSSIPNPEALRNWIYRDGWIFPFVSVPDMSNDSEINRYAQLVDNHDVAALSDEIDTQRLNLENCSFIDRTNRYKISRRLSFIAKHVRQDPTMHYLALIDKAARLDDAMLGLKLLQNILQTRKSIQVNGKDLVLTEQKRQDIVQVARRLIEKRSDYQAERRKYQTAVSGGQLLSGSPVLNQIDMLLSYNAGLSCSSSSQVADNNSLDPFTDALTRRINIHPAVDPQIRIALTDLQAHDSYFRNYLEATINKLKELEFHGLLTNPTSAFEHGINHFVESLIPTNPLENPKEFSINVIRYTALGVIHTWTGGVLIPVQTAAQIALKINDLRSIDISNMSAKEFAEFVAEELAEIAYTLVTTKVIQKVKDAKIPEGFVNFSRELFKGSDAKVAMEGGVTLSASEAESQALKIQPDQKVKGGSRVASRYSYKNGRYEDASYHTSKGNSVKSAKPIDGQHALDNSFEFKDTSPRRIAVSNGQFVVMDQTSPGIFHGHVREWDDLRQKMKNVLIKNKVVKPNGKIIR